MIVYPDRERRPQRHHGDVEGARQSGAITPVHVDRATIAVSPNAERHRWAGEPIAIRTSCVDDAMDRIGKVLHPHNLTRVEPKRHILCRLDAVSTGPIVWGRLQYDSNSDLYCPVIDGYHINVPLAGTLISRCRDTLTAVSPHTAVLYETDTEAHILSPENSLLNMFAIKIDRSAVQSVLCDLLGHAADAPLQLHGTIDLSTADGTAWWRIVTDIYRGQLSGTLMTSPVMTKPLIYSTIVGLLTLGHHNFSEALHDEGAQVAPAVIRRAAEYIYAHAAEPVTPADIAAAVGLSVRSLQRGFRDHYRCTPSDYLRAIRLRRVREDLANALPDTASVTKIASQWGFHHHGRFAAEYRRMFGESPSHTLRGS